MRIRKAWWWKVHTYNASWVAELFVGDPFDSGPSHVLAAPISFYLRVTLAISKIPITFVLTDPVCEFFD
jgi:hypothetical protein